MRASESKQFFSPSRPFNQASWFHVENKLKGNIDEIFVILENSNKKVCVTERDSKAENEV